MLNPIRSEILVVALLLVAGCADSILLLPPHGAFRPKGAQEQIIPLQNGSLQIWRKQADPAREPPMFVLEFCGNATSAEQIVNYSAQRWQKQGAEVWAVNYPGFGTSTGPASLRQIPPAALAAFDALRAHAGDRPILVCGSSLGTAAALYVAAHRPTSGLLLQNPPPLRDLILHQYGWWNLWIAAGIVAVQIPLELDSPTNAALITVPAVFVLADGDTLVPPPFHRKVVDAFAGPKQVVILHHANHNSGVNSTEEAEIQAAVQKLIFPSK